METEDVVLWRYLTLDKFLAMITEGRLYFARLDSFDDPDEGFCKVLRPESKGEDLTGNPAAQLFSGLGTHLQENLPGIVRTCVFASCWCSSTTEAELLWKQYAPGGVVVKSSTKRFWASLAQGELEDPKSQLRLQCIAYSPDIRGDSRNTFDLTNGKIPLAYNTWMTPAFVKSAFYEHDREWRAAIFANDPVIGDRPGLSIRFDIQALAEAVYVSPFAPTFLVDTLRTLIYALRLDINVYQSKFAGRLRT
jgi:hypothetical protein